jgi:hypothetical protein
MGGDCCSALADWKGGAASSVWMPALPPWAYRRRVFAAAPAESPLNHTASIRRASLFSARRRASSPSNMRSRKPKVLEFRSRRLSVYSVQMLFTRPWVFLQVRSLVPLAQ